jgi:hypothetical protein
MTIVISLVDNLWSGDFPRVIFWAVFQCSAFERALEFERDAHRDRPGTQVPDSRLGKSQRAEKCASKVTIISQM